MTVPGKIQQSYRFRIIMAISRPMRESPLRMVFAIEEEAWTTVLMRCVRCWSADSCGSSCEGGVGGSIIVILQEDLSHNESLCQAYFVLSH
jgi:hypothetical protein